MMPTEYKRNARFAGLVQFDSFAKPDDFIEITEWYNGEGFDVHLSTSTGERSIQFTWGEFHALRATLGNWIEDEDEESS